MGVYTDLAKTTNNTNPPLGAIGIAVNGAALFGNSDANNLDAFQNEGSTFDTCGGIGV